MNSAERKSRIDKTAIKNALRGQCPGVFAGLGINIATKILRGGHGPCPRCGGTDRLRFFDLDGEGSFICSQGGGEPLTGDGIGFVMHALGVDFQTALVEIAECLRLQRSTDLGSRPQPKTQTAWHPNRDDAADRARIEAIAAEAKPLDPAGDVIAYLRHRGLAKIIDDLPSDLLERTNVPYFDGERVGGRFTTMLALIRAPDGSLANVHETYMEHGRKAPVGEPKKFGKRKGALRGAAIRLYDPAETLAIAEGIENALAVRATTGLPVWSGMNAHQLALVEVPASVRRVEIWPDPEPTGMHAAMRLRERLIAAGVEVRLMTARAGLDPLDAYLAPDRQIAEISTHSASDDAAQQAITRFTHEPLSRRLVGNRCRCPACGEYFNSEKSFDQHRVGKYTEDRRCKTVDDMEASGMILSDTGWLARRKQGKA
jgi:putative DNA primase/helicase